MKDNIYENANFLNGSVDEYEKMELNELEAKRFKKKFKKKRSLAKIAIAAALVLALSQIGIGATATSIIKDLSYSISYSLYGNKEQTPYANMIKETVSDNGIDIKLNECLIDENSLIVSYLVDTKKTNLLNIGFDEKVYINGKKARIESATGSMGLLDKEKSNSVFTVYNQYDIKNIPLDKDLDIRLVLFNMEETTVDDVENYKNTGGKWEFNFVANGQELAKNTKRVKINEKLKLDNIELTIEDLCYNSVIKKMHAKADECPIDYNLELRGVDNLGNKVLFDISRIDGKDVLLQYEPLLSSLSEDATYIDFTPYAVKIPKESGRMPQNYKKIGETFRVDLQ